jgi:hypothetical protein
MLVLIISIASTTSSASDATVKLKAGGAVTAFIKEDGFKLTDIALRNLEVNFNVLPAGSTWEIPKSSLVRVKKSIGVYRRYDGWITMVLVSVINKSKNTVTIKSVDLQSGDDVAVSGVTFLRMTDSDLNSDTVDACSH